MPLCERATHPTCEVSVRDFQNAPLVEEGSGDQLEPGREGQSRVGEEGFELIFADPFGVRDLVRIDGQVDICRREEHVVDLVRQSTPLKSHALSCSPQRPSLGAR